MMAIFMQLHVSWLTIKQIFSAVYRIRNLYFCAGYMVATTEKSLIKIDGISRGDRPPTRSPPSSLLNDRESQQLFRNLIRPPLTLQMSISNFMRAIAVKLGPFLQWIHVFLFEKTSLGSINGKHNNYCHSNFWKMVIWKKNNKTSIRHNHKGSMIGRWCEEKPHIK